MSGTCPGGQAHPPWLTGAYGLTVTFRQITMQSNIDRLAHFG
jgi:hypothetical protein